MHQSIKKRPKDKPAKPYREFPLFPHATGRWAKKIRGRFHYFGPWNDPDAALAKYQDQKDDLHAGRMPRVKQDGLTVRDLCNRFLTSKKHLRETGEIAERTFYEYHRACEKVIDAFSRHRLVTDLSADDFHRLRVNLSETLGSVGLGNEIGRVQMVFKFAFDEALIDIPIRYGQSFKKPSPNVLRKARAASGKRMFEAAEVRKIIDAAGLPLRAMVLLGINCGFGQSDLSNLPQDALALDRGWVDYPRPKTGVERRCPLWPETVASLREALVGRPATLDDSDDELVFVTKYGRRWVRTNAAGTPDDAIGKEVSKLLKTLELKRPGVSFYALRHSFETIGGESRDQVAVDHLMGHARNDMASVYRERIDDKRLRKVVEVTVHRSGNNDGGACFEK